MTALLPGSLHPRFDRVLAVTAAAWGLSLPLPLPAHRVARALGARPPVARVRSTAAAPFSGLAISY